MTDRGPTSTCGLAALTEETPLTTNPVVLFTSAERTALAGWTAWVGAESDYPSHTAHVQAIAIRLSDPLLFPLVAVGQRPDGKLLPAEAVIWSKLPRLLAIEALMAKVAPLVRELRDWTCEPKQRALSAIHGDLITLLAALRVPEEPTT